MRVSHSRGGLGLKIEVKVREMTRAGPGGILTGGRNNTFFTVTSSVEVDFKV